jgi:DNA-binding NarL/FixJ family response regulator
MTDLFLVDDHALFREGLRSLLQARSGMRIVAEAADAHSALELADTARFDVALVDVRLRDTSGIALVRDMRRRKVTQPILMLSMFDRAELVSEALRAGASGYLTKEATATELEHAIATVLRGEEFVPPKIAASIEHSTPTAVSQLSSREREVFELLICGRSNDEIASALFISEKTVETHRTRIYRKLGVTSLAELVWLGARHDLVADRGSLRDV